jgi:branched-chain amino acid transport system permease protein
MTAVPMNTSSFRVERSTRLSRMALSGAVALVALGASLPFWAGSDWLVTLVELLYFLALAQMWNLLAGYGGLVSIGQQAYVGLGAYVMVALALFAGIHPFVAVPMAGVVAGLAAWPAARLLFRLQGPYFAIGSWVFAEILRLLISNDITLGGGSGISITAAVSDMDSWWRESISYWMALAIGVGSVAAVYALLRSRHGLALTAVRDSETASESVGVPVQRIKRLVYIAAAAGTGVIGALIFVTKLRVSPDAAFSVEWSALVIFMVIIGGVGTIEGPILGTLLYFVLRHFLADYGSWYLIALGAIAVLTMLTVRGGLWGWLVNRYDCHLFPVQRRLQRSAHVPTPAVFPTAPAARPGAGPAQPDPAT